MPPGDFLGIARETGLIVAIDEFVQQQSFSDLARWRAIDGSQLRLSVNLSTTQLEQEAFVSRFLQRIRDAKLDPASIKVEITEDTLMQEVEVVVPKLKALREAGIQVAIDDFGTGYSSLSYLQHFPVNTLKIDRSFVRDIRAERADASIIDAIVAMARGLRMSLIAEGVETRNQLHYLRQQGCREIQGYIFSEPLPATEIKRLLLEDPFPHRLQTLVDAATADV